MGRISPGVWGAFSIAFYVAACLLPVFSPSEGPPEPIYGYQCLAYGLMFCWLGWPLLLWLPNPAIWALWWHAFYRHSAGLKAVLLIPLYTLAAAVGTGMMYAPRYRAVPGVFLWVASSGLAAWAAWQSTPRMRNESATP